jgi:hypothetical protein
MTSAANATNKAKAAAELCSNRPGALLASVIGPVVVAVGRGET